MKILIILLFLSTQILSEEHKLLLTVGDEWFPYYYMDENRSFTGLDIELADLILIEADIEYTVKSYPSIRGLAMIKNGESNMITGASFTEERSKYAYYSLPYRDETIALLVRKGTGNEYPLSTLSDMIDLSIKLSGQYGSWYGDEYEKLLSDPTFIKNLYLNNSLKNRLMMLTSGRIDMIIDDKYALLFTAKQLGVQDLVELHTYIPYEDLVHFIFSKESVDKSVVDKVNNAIENKTKDGSMKRVFDRYIKSETSKNTK
ncbi:MAG: transporter substrate-binding domain-containing protein [Spirochaetaceae bacterium]